MAPASTAPRLPRRSLLQTLLALPAFTLFRPGSREVPAAEPDDVVEIGGWILKRSEVA